LRKTSALIVNRIAITKARINLGQLAKRVHLNNEYFILEKDGIPVVGLMDADELEDYLELRDPTVMEFIAESRKDYIAGHTRPAEELLAQLKRQAPGKIKNRKCGKI
jgi:PHD/YefM family antitoxin component YafN of YafNO toxin-antitoxin module